MKRLVMDVLNKTLLLFYYVALKKQLLKTIL